MNQNIMRAQIVFYALVAVTIGTYLLTFDSIWLKDSSYVNALAVIIAFIKARYVALDFMDLRGNEVMRYFDGWITVVCTICVFLILT